MNVMQHDSKSSNNTAPWHCWQEVVHVDNRGRRIVERIIEPRLPATPVAFARFFGQGALEVTVQGPRGETVGKQNRPFGFEIAAENVIAAYELFNERFAAAVEREKDKFEAEARETQRQKAQRIVIPQAIGR